MKKFTYSNISTQHIKDIQILFSATAIAALVLFSLNFQIQHSDFAKLDVNRDGKLSPEEVASDEVLASGFDVADTDVNGTIDSSEYSVYIITASSN